MRTLNRPMFKMGGSIKQGIMHGIREPHKHGGPTGTGLVGDQRYPKTGGREHHAFFLPALAAPAAWTAARSAAMRYLPRGLAAAKRIFGKTTPASVTRGGKPVAEAVGSYSPVTTTASKFTPNWLGRDPLVKTVGATGRAIFNPTVGGWAGKAARLATSPSSIVAGVAYYMWPDGKERTEPPTPGTGVPGGGDKGMYYEAPGKGKGKELTDQQRKDFANAQRNQRVEKYMEMMGYDRSKKTAIADALIDVSKIVSDRGTLDRKNITGELINPAIQALSKRLDKPEQIREAVGLMATKAEIEKDLKQEENVLAKTLTQKRIDKLDQELGSGFEDDLRALVASSKEKVGKKQLERFARLTADKYGDTFTVVTDATVIGNEPGVYMVEDKIFRVDDDGQAKQIV